MVIIFTGQSGLDRKPYLSDLERIANEKHHTLKIFLVGDIMYDVARTKKGNILDLPLGELNAHLRTAFERIRREMVAYDHVVVNMHATFRWKRGLIGGSDYQLIEPLRPDLFVTLIDDVTDVKARLDEEYPEKDYSFKDVMVWREEEILTTSIFANLTRKPHFIFARKHPVETLYKLLFERELPRIYVSFPISNVLDKPEILNEINEFKEQLVREFTVFDPYTISEKKLDYKLRVAEKTGQSEFDYEVRGENAKIPVDEVRPIIQDINDQIIARDLMLVEQSEMVVAFYPCFEDGTPIHSAGREREVSHARDTGSPVYIIWPSSKQEPGPFEGDVATKTFRSVSEARDFLVRKYAKAPSTSN